MLRESGPLKLFGSLRINKSRRKSESLSRLIEFFARRIDRIDCSMLFELGCCVDSVQ